MVERKCLYCEEPLVLVDRGHTLECVSCGLLYSSGFLNNADFSVLQEERYEIQKATTDSGRPLVWIVDKEYGSGD